MEKKRNYVAWIHIAKNFKTRFDTSNYVLERPLTKEKEKK